MKCLSPISKALPFEGPLDEVRRRRRELRVLQRGDQLAAVVTGLIGNVPQGEPTRHHQRGALLVAIPERLLQVIRRPRRLTRKDVMCARDRVGRGGERWKRLLVLGRRRQTASSQNARSRSARMS